MTNFEFTFKTDAEYSRARISGFTSDYKAVRMTTEMGDSTHNFPIHSEEEFYKTLNNTDHDVLDVYSSTIFNI